MQKVMDFLKSRTIGFFISAAAALLSLISAILYAGFFASEPEMSWVVFVLPLVAFLVSAALLVVPFFFSRLEKLTVPFVPFILTTANLFALCLFAEVGYKLINRLVVGHADKMDNIFTFFGAGLPVCLILMVVVAVLSTIAIFTKQIKKEKEPTAQN